MNSFQTPHILTATQFSLDQIAELFKKASSFRHLILKGGAEELSLSKALDGKILFSVFHEPSTRTRFSFEIGAHRLGMKKVSTEAAGMFSSAFKGETLEDSIKVFCQYRPHVIVLRHPETGSAQIAARVADPYGIPIINAGDGKGEHPTQALLDLFTIQEKLKRLEDLTVVLGGDLANGRTARSLCRLLCLYKNIRFVFIAPETLQMSEDVCEEIVAAGHTYQKTTDMREGLLNGNVFYWTRIQLERMPRDKQRDFRTKGSPFRIGLAEMGCMNEDAILLHPLPRVDEIAPEVDADPRAAYFDQAGNGMFVRMALLHSLLSR